MCPNKTPCRTHLNVFTSKGSPFNPILPPALYIALSWQSADCSFKVSPTFTASATERITSHYDQWRDSLQASFLHRDIRLPRLLLLVSSMMLHWPQDVIKMQQEVELTHLLERSQSVTPLFFSIARLQLYITDAGLWFCAVDRIVGIPAAQQQHPISTAYKYL